VFIPISVLVTDVVITVTFGMLYHFLVTSFEIYSLFMLHPVEPLITRSDCCDHPQGNSGSDTKVGEMHLLTRNLIVELKFRQPFESLLFRINHDSPRRSMSMVC
jgi:hypothetical protein